MNQFQSLKYVDTIPREEKVRRLVWEVVWVLLFRTTPRWTLHGWRRFLLKSFGAKIGNGSRIAPSCRVWAPWNLTMGELSVLGDDVDCYTMDRITIGSKVAVSQRAFLCAGTHDVSSLLRPLVTRPITIGDHCWIAAEAMVMPGVTIHEGAVIGARALVTKDQPAWMICGGHPCKPIKPRTLAGDRHQDTDKLS